MDEVQLEDIINDNYYLERFIKSKPKSNLFLNFNYTNLESPYCIYLNEVEVINIHGRLVDHNNPIIFGYGDEIAKEYKEIEDLHNNDFLENVKSMKYLETDNYNRLLTYMDSDFFQLFIFGHSCGVSDRTLLNTIFEHQKCVSIKVFYHNWEEITGSGQYTDNFSDLVRNISRNFNSKVVMREKVVNKKYCESLS